MQDSDSPIFTETVLSKFDVKVGILLKCEIYLHDHVISLKHKLFWLIHFFHWSVCAKLEKWAIIFILVKGIDFSCFSGSKEAVVVVIVWLLDLQIPMQSVHIITKVERSIPAHGEVYSILHYEIQFVNDLRHVGCFLRVLRFTPPIKLTFKI